LLRRFGVNTLKVFLGAGILTMPFGMKQVKPKQLLFDERSNPSQAGLVTGAATLVILSYVSVSCMLMIVECKNQILQEVGRSTATRDADELSFGSMADELLGPRGKFWADFTVVFTQLAFGTAYIIYAGSNCSLVAQTYGYSFSFIGLDSAVLLMIMAGAAVSPFVLLRYLSPKKCRLNAFLTRT
jgi:amino acid permease